MVLGLSLLHCCNKTETVAEIDDPIRVEWIYRRVFTGGGRGGGMSETGMLEVKRDPVIKINAGCWEPKPQLAATTDEVAFRCDEGKPWRLAYLGKGGAWAFLHCDDVLGTAGAPDFAAMPAFDVALPRLVDCGAHQNQHRPQPSFAAFWTEAKTRTSDARLAELLMQSAHMPFRVERKYDGKTEDDWEDGYALLPPGEKKRVDVYLERRLREKSPPISLFQRAVWHVSPLDAGLKDSYRARVEELLASKPKSDAGARDLMVLIARLHLLGDPNAGELACRTLSNTWLDTFSQDLKVIVAFAGYQCEKAREDLEKNPCNVAYDCGDGRQRHLCTKEEVMATAADDVKALATDRTATNRSESPALAAGYVFDELPKSVQLAAARRGYAGPSVSTSCYADDANPNEECDCFSEALDLDEAVCELAGKTEGDYHKGCRIVIDDANQRIRVYPQPKPDAKPATSSKPATSASGG
jgi:hypothetical protein